MQPSTAAWGDGCSGQETVSIAFSTSLPDGAKLPQQSAIMTANKHRFSLYCELFQAQQRKARRLLVIVMSLGGVSKLLLNAGQLGRQLIPVLHQISPRLLSLLQLS